MHYTEWRRESSAYHPSGSPTADSSTTLTARPYQARHSLDLTHCSVSMMRDECDDDNDNDTVIADDFREVNELPAVDIKTSSWKGTLISILVICMLCSAIIFAIYVINPDIQYKLTRTANKERLRLSEWLNGNYTGQSTFNGTWISDTEITFINAEAEFVLYDVAQNSIQVIVHATLIKQYEVSRAILSPDRRFVLFVSHIKNVFRHSTLAHYKIFNRASEILEDVKPSNENEPVYLQAVQWGPQGSQLAFVYKNNLYYMKEANVATIRQISHTDSEKQPHVYNGIPDWIYEEEILAVGIAFWWSSDGARLAYAQFDDTEVELQEYPWYGDTVDRKSQYLGQIQIKYPKPGRTNPTVKLFTVKLDDNEPNPVSWQVIPPQNISDKDYYLTSVAWADQNSLIAVWFTREQNYSSYSVCDQPNDWQCKDNYIFQVKNGWVEISKVYVGPDKENYYTLLADHTQYQNVQIVKINIKTGQAKYLTDGRQDVTAILAIVKSEITNRSVIYYMSTRASAPGERHAYSVEESSSRRTYVSAERAFRSRLNSQQTTSPSVAVPHCYTCDQIELNQCRYNRVSFSLKSTYYVQECLGPEIPHSTLRHASNVNFTKSWVENEQLQATLANKLLPKVMTEIIPKNGYDIIVQMFLPPSLKEDEIVKYPLLIQVYGGPGSQNVNEVFKMNFGKYLAGSKGIIYAYIDARGSGYRGEALKYQLYHRLGTAEIEDQITAARELIKKHKWINKDAIGIWGWSYGGYATAMALAKDNILAAQHQLEPVFACGISVAPVTSWLLYDSAYTERYMGLPINNSESYFESDVMHLANQFKGKKYLLIHGTADDNVHIQNSMALIKALNQANVMFQTQIYPDENHALPSVNLHLYNTMENFWNECFQMDSFVEEIGLRRRRVVKQQQP